MAGVLLVGEDRKRVAELRALLRQDGHSVAWHQRLENWRAREREMTPDVVIAPVESCDQSNPADQRANLPMERHHTNRAIAPHYSPLPPVRAPVPNKRLR